MNKFIDRLPIIIFCAIITVVPIMTKIEKPVAYSIFENRNMADPPKLSVKELFEGTYLPKWDVYFSDQVWKRNDFLARYTQLNMDLLKRPVVNNVVIQDDLLLPFIDFTDMGKEHKKEAEEMTNNLSRLNMKVTEYGGRFLYIGMPEQYSMLRERYPNYLNNGAIKLSGVERDFFALLNEKGIANINMRTEFLKTDSSVYYSTTDHHYNLRGAYFTYKKLIEYTIEKFGINAPLLMENEIEYKRLDNPFYGSRNRKLYNIYPSNESLLYYKIQNDIGFERWDNGKPVEPNIFILPKDDSTPATYNIYMGGDIGETIIRTYREDLPNVLLFGDSFTNPFETFLYHSFNETRSIDLRHYGKKTIIEYVNEYKPDLVICLRDDTSYLSNTGNGEIK